MGFKSAFDQSTVRHDVTNPWSRSNGLGDRGAGIGAAPGACACVWLHVSGRRGGRSDRPQCLLRRPAERPHPRDARRHGARPPTSLICRARSSRRRAGAARPGVLRRTTRRSGRFFVNFTNRPGDTVVARFRRSADPVVADPASRFDLRWGGANGATFIRAAVREPQRRQSRVRSRRLPLHRPGRRRLGQTIRSTARRTRTSCSARCCASTSTCPTAIPIGYRVPPDNPFVSGRPVAARAGDLGVRPAQPVALHLRRPGARRHRRARDRRRRPEPLRGDRLRAGAVAAAATTAGATAKARTTTSTTLPRRVPAAGRSDLTNTATASGSRSPAGSSIAAARSAPRIRGATSSPTTCRDASGRWRWPIDDRGRGARVGSARAHAPSSAARRVGSVSSFGVDADGELLIVGYARGTISRIIGPAAAPSAPSGLRIIRP